MDEDLIELLRNDSIDREDSSAEPQEQKKSTPGTLALLASILKVREEQN